MGKFIKGQSGNPGGSSRKRRRGKAIKNIGVLLDVNLGKLEQDLKAAGPEERQTFALKLAAALAASENEALTKGFIAYD